jgi:uncharacterized protein (TIGR02246 family)
LNHLEQSVTSVIDAYKQAVRDKDVAAFMALYADDVRVFDTWAVWVYEGAASWRKAVASWFSSLGSENVRVTADDVRVVGTPALAVVSAIFTYAGLAADGRELRAMQNRLTWALAQHGASWKIVHEHTSAPIAPDHATAMLTRDKRPT